MRSRRGTRRSALRFVGALAWFWMMRDYDAEAGEWAAAVAQIAGDAAPPAWLTRTRSAIVLAAMTLVASRSRAPAWPG